MTPNLPTTFAGVTSGMQNIFDIASQLVNLRKHNRLISAGQLERLNIAIKATIQADRIASVHKLEAYATAFLIESYEDIKRYLNTPMGDVLLESIQHEAHIYRRHIDSFCSLTESDGFR